MTTEETVAKPRATRAAAVKPDEYKVPHVHQAILKILGEIGVEKNGELPANMGGKPYITAADLAKEIKKALHAEGVIALPFEHESRKEIINGSRLIVTVSIEAQYTLISTKDGSEETIRGVGDGVAQGSAVASNIASTNAFKNAFLRAFLITEQSVEEYAKNGPGETPEPRALASQRAPQANPDVARINALKKELTGYATPDKLEAEAKALWADPDSPSYRDGGIEGWNRSVPALEALLAHYKAKAGEV